MGFIERDGESDDDHAGKEGASNVEVAGEEQGTREGSEDVG